MEESLSLDSLVKEKQSKKKKTSISDSQIQRDDTEIQQLEKGEIQDTQKLNSEEDPLNDLLDSKQLQTQPIVAYQKFLKWDHVSFPFFLHYDSLSFFEF